MERRLAAILAADVVGYSRLMGDDEAGTLAELKAQRKKLIDPKAAQYNGRTKRLNVKAFKKPADVEQIVEDLRFAGLPE